MSLLAFDTETWLITDRNKIPKPVCCTWSDGTSAWISRPGDSVTYHHIANPETIFIGQNIAYDILVMMRWERWTIPFFIKALDEGRVFDTMIRECMLHLSTKGGFGYRPYWSMADLAMKYFSLDMSAEKNDPDAWRLRYGTLDHLPIHKWPKKALDYALDDARLTYRIFQAQGGLNDIQPTEPWQVQAAVTLSAMGSWGLMVNRGRQAELMERQNIAIDSLQEQIGPLGWTGKGSQKRLGDAVTQAFAYQQAKTFHMYVSIHGIDINWDVWQAEASNMCLKKYLSHFVQPGVQFPALIRSCPPNVNWQEVLHHAMLAVPEMPMTKKGISTAEETLKNLYDINGDFKKYVDLKHEIKMRSTYLEPFQLDVSHGRYTPMVSTGRTACSPGHQTIPRDGGYRSQFCPRPRHLFGTIDYSGLELCTLSASIRTWYPNVECILGNLIDQGFDPHCYTASLMLNLPYEQVNAGKKGEYKDPRQQSKAVNFGKPGGLGLGALLGYAESTFGVKMTPDEGRAVIQAWELAFPEVPNVYLANNKKAIGGHGKKATAQTIWGRKKALCTYTEMSNYPFQALAADGAKLAMYAIFREIQLSWYYTYCSQADGYGKEFAGSPLRDSHLTIFVHDELVMDHPESALGEEAFKRQETLMVDKMTEACNHKIKISTEGKLDPLWDH